MPPWLLEYEIEPGTFVDVEVILYRPGSDMIVTGWGFGDAEPGKPEKCEYNLTINNGPLYGEPYDPTPDEAKAIEKMIAEVFADDF